jgi:hypothetical protein
LHPRLRCGRGAADHKVRPARPKGEFALFMLDRRSTSTARPCPVSTILAPRSREEVRMPPRGVKSAKRKRQYEKIKASAKKRGRSNAVAERIAAATTNKTRRRKGETKGARKRSSSRKRSTGGRKRSSSKKR